ncbi:MAG: transcriptional regulator NrdR [Nitrospirota bacterium]|jgi:transcriptional repressor NrdR
MKCPFCGHLEDKVIDSRSAKDGSVIRRRRECLQCEKRFTSYERVEDLMPMVIKKDGSREPFDRQKILKGLDKALHKRPVDVETRERAVDEIEKNLLSMEVREVQSSVIGEELMSRLQDMDKIAYVRFASVYREFKDINEFMDELQGLLKSGHKKGLKGGA